MKTVAKTPQGYTPVEINVVRAYCRRDGVVAYAAAADTQAKHDLGTVAQYLRDRHCDGWYGEWFDEHQTLIELLPERGRKGGPQMKAGIAAAIVAECLGYEAPDTLVVGGLSLTDGVTDVEDVEAIADAIPPGVIVGAAPDTAAALQALGHRTCKLYGLGDFIYFAYDPQTYQENNAPRGPAPPISLPVEPRPVDFSEIIGQKRTKWWFMVAAAGRHNILPVGPHGQGKSLLARAIHGVLPPLSPAELRSVTKIHTMAGKKVRGNGRPLQSVTRDVSLSALFGGGTGTLEPGAVSLASSGILHIDEFLEMPRGKIESLRQVMEERVISIVRTQFKATLPADFQLVGTANRCACGRLGHPTLPCACSRSSRLAYAAKLSHAMADRIDLIAHIEVVPVDQMLHERAGARSTSKEYRKWVSKAWDRQFSRWGVGNWNATISGERILSLPMSSAVEAVASSSTALSPRSLVKALKVAWTIADVYGDHELSPWHVRLAIDGVTRGL
jgi:magnesium chelatase family protein